MLAAAISEQEGAHLAGSKNKVNRQRTADEGVMFSKELLDKIKHYATM